ncbi:MAG: hypothetical protein JWL81_2335 [Verrucomicrobiales bacterium]|nr:hypothetical protein [Verrucomicrobiales bacterium]
MWGAFIRETGSSPDARRLLERTRRSLLRAWPELAIQHGPTPPWQDLASAFPSGFLVIAAGAWFPFPDKPAPPVPSATGRPVLGFGLAPDSAPAWHALRRGPESNHPSAPDFPLSSTQLPPVLGLDAAACRSLGGGTAFDDLLAKHNPRVIHLQNLDVMTDPGIRISQVITSLQYGGAERLALHLHHELALAGTAAQMIILGKPGRRPFPTPAPSADLSHLPTDPESRAHAVVNAAARFGSDLLHAHLLSAAELQALQPHGIPVILTLHNTSRGWPAGLSSLTGKDVRLLAACSLEVAADARALLPRLPVRTAWNGIDLTDFQPASATPASVADFRQTLGLPPAGLLILTLANPRPQKRFDRLPAILAALRKLAPARPFRLLIAGEAAYGNEEAAAAIAETRVAADHFKVADNIIWHGASEDVPGLLAAADVLLSTSAHEGLSLAHLEALAMGVPVVALEAGGTAETAHTAGSAMTVLPQDAGPEQIAKAVLTAFPNPASRESIRRCFSSEAMARRYRQLYHRALHAPSGPGQTVWLITNNFAIGGAQSSARRLLTYWKNQGMTVRAAVLQEEPGDPTPGRTALLEAGIPVLILPRLGPHDAAVTIAALWPHLDADPPRAVLFWNAVTSCKLLIADGLPNTPIFDISPGGMYFESLHPSFEKPRPDAPSLTPRDYGRQLSGMVVKYASEAPIAARALGIPVTVIPNGIDVPELPVPLRPGPWSAATPFRFGTAARLHPQKDIKSILDAFRLALPDLPPSELHIAGGPDGHDVEYVALLKKHAEGLTVVWHDELTEPGALPRFHGMLDVFVMISKPAGCPNASLEALAAGLPVIATDFGGASEQVLDEITGLLVPTDDTPAFARAMIRLATDPTLRATCALNARRHIADHFSMTLMAGRYQKLISSPGGATVPKPEKT